ncbi:neuroendocrine convertase 1-like [Battus philenor]|uniref:neuroendocrine convertase 1-like n=1 Tax=Battus philenor TaxID=42288 RepID=UPI0035D04AD4
MSFVQLNIVCIIISTVSPISSYEVPGEHGYHEVHNGLENSKGMVNEWTVEVDGGDQVAQLVALQLGYEFGGVVLGFPNTYTFRAYEHNKQRRTPTEHTTMLNNDSRVRWAEQLFIKSRVKRYPFIDSDKELQRIKRVENDVPSLFDKKEKKEFITNENLFNDELWGYQWYLQDTRTDQELPRLDLNVLPVYEMGVNGHGVRVSVLDDGVEYNHTDLRENYDPEISWDCNDHDADPYPRNVENNRNSHGTRCAGEIAMTANNGKCGVGVAFGARVGGVRMLDGRITDRIEGEAIGYAWDKVDIYSASWGPNDDGRTVEGPGRLATEALKRGVTKGRDGKGSIYVWANGNGGGHNDNCNCDGYSSSIYTISIGSASQHGMFPWYGEICSSTLATAYSSGAYKDQKIATTDTNDSCTLKHTGTSAAAPLAAGIIALVLQANPNLTWRDIQHLIVWTSEYSPLSHNPGWQINGAGLRFDIRFGFGLLNADVLVKTALNWTTVPKKTVCHIEALPLKMQRSVSSQKAFDLDVYVRDCDVNFIEHVELYVTAKYNRRGALQIYVVSPQGTKVQVLSARPRDTSTAGFVNWPFTSVATWGENPYGVWHVIIEDKSNEENYGEIESLKLVIHGTKDIPNHMKNGPRKYNFHYNSEFQNIMDYVDFDDPFENRPAFKDENLNDIESEAMITQIEEELFRKHHSRIFKRPLGAH